MIEIRAALSSDAPRLAQLRWEFRAGRDAPAEEHDAFVDRCAAWMAMQLTSGAWRAWVADENGVIVGHVWLHVISKIPNPVGERDRHAYISNVYVIPSSRGGVGARLLQSALDWASANHVDRIVLWPTTRSRSLYLRYGFTPNGDVLERTCS